MNNLGEFEVGELGTCFSQEGKGEFVRFQTILFHLEKEKEGFVGTVLVHRFSYSRVPSNNG